MLLDELDPKIRRFRDILGDLINDVQGITVTRMTVVSITVMINDTTM